MLHDGVELHYVSNAGYYLCHISSEKCHDPTTLTVMVINNIGLKDLFFKTSLNLIGCVSSFLALIMNGRLFYPKWGSFEQNFLPEYSFFKECKHLKHQRTLYTFFLWDFYLFFIQKQNIFQETVETLFQRAFSTGLLVVNSMVYYNQSVNLDICKDDVANRSWFLSRSHSLFLHTWTNC